MINYNPTPAAPTPAHPRSSRPFRTQETDEDKHEPSCSAPAEEDPSNPFGGGSSNAFAPAEQAPTACSLDLASKDPGSMKWAPATTPVDRRITEQEHVAIAANDDGANDCADADLPEFWMDMCGYDAPPPGSKDHGNLEYVNLQLNPERWTGYNGSHVWSAIYEENCLKQSGSVDDMCYEERVLYRLLSGMHASVNIHIALKAKTPKKGVVGREDWSADPARFAAHYGQHPERLRNLHFSFVVLLRALRKAAPTLGVMDLSLGQDKAEDARTGALMRRLLDTHILSSCSGVFGAFDESMLFRGGAGVNGEASSPVAELKSQFKGVFHNISEVMDCISCQKCKLHGKLQLLGLGTALKVLLLPEHLHATALSRSEVVALVNTVAKFSHAILAAPELAAAHSDASTRAATAAAPVPDLSSAGIMTASSDWTPATTRSLMDAAISAVAALASDGAIGAADEDALVDAAVAADPRVLILARHYGVGDPSKFAQHALRAVRSGPFVGYSSNTAVASSSVKSSRVDVVVVGGGLAGLTAALTALDRGGRVTLVEKEGYVGGNSQWASSGINGVDLANATNPDTVETFESDCWRSSLGGGAGAATGATLGCDAVGQSRSKKSDDSTPTNKNDSCSALGGPSPESVEHIPTLAAGSVETLTWLRDRVGVDLSRVGQLGGHSHARTHRPASGMAGSTLVLALQKQCETYAKSGALTWRKKTRVDEITMDPATGAVSGVRWTTKDGTVGFDSAKSVVLATGGFANDREGPDSLLRKHAPDSTRFATTNTKGTTGDGHKLAFGLGAQGVDMANVQIHPTGFVDPNDPKASTKTLAAEILRGAGGLLLTRDGRRFADELGTRDYVSGRMLAEAKAEAAAGGLEVGEDVSLDFALVLNDAGAREADKHVPLYTQKGLLREFDTVEDLAAWLDDELRAKDMRGHHAGTDTVATVRATLAAYDAVAKSGGPDPETNKTFFHNAPFLVPSGKFYAGRVTPVVHYTMGGVRVDNLGRVVREGGDGSVIPGLYAAGELIGGVHGRNRLGGNALTECAVFGRIVGGDVPVASPSSVDAGGGAAPTAAAPARTARRDVTREELSRHKSEESCWVAVYGEVYDFTDFLDEHPAGAEAILKYGGTDGTAIFDSVHSRDMLDDFDAVGPLVD